MENTFVLPELENAEVSNATDTANAVAITPLPLPLSLSIPKEIYRSVQERYLVSNTMLVNAIYIVDHDQIRPAPSGNFVVKSQSLERTEYIIDPVAERCGCPAGRNDRMCKHMVAYLLRREMFEYAKRKATETNEAQVAMVVVKPKRTEWQEELDLYI